MTARLSAGTSRPFVLFVCDGNTCRSVLAEYIAKEEFEQLIDSSSAGLCPGTMPDCENAVYTLKKQFGINASGHVPRDVKSVPVEDANFVVAMTNQVAVKLRKLFPGLAPERLVRWDIQDPYGDNLEEYCKCARSILRELKKLPFVAD